MGIIMELYVSTTVMLVMRGVALPPGCVSLTEAGQMKLQTVCVSTSEEHILMSFREAPLNGAAQWVSPWLEPNVGRFSLFHLGHKRVSTTFI